jgi:hypothetical protein
MWSGTGCPRAQRIVSLSDDGGIEKQIADDFLGRRDLTLHAHCGAPGDPAGRCRPSLHLTGEAEMPRLLMAAEQAAMVSLLQKSDCKNYR